MLTIMLTYLYSLEDKSYFNRLTKYSINIALFIVLPAIVTMSCLSKEICSLISGQEGYENAYIVLISLALAAVQGCDIYRVNGDSMSPTFEDGNLIVGLRIRQGSEPADLRGKTVVLHSPVQEYVIIQVVKNVMEG